MTSESPIYRRELPGGGYVAIAVARDANASITRVSVERRATHERRENHAPVVIAEAAGDDQSPAFGDLFKLAADNAAIARVLLQKQGRQRIWLTADG